MKRFRFQLETLLKLRRSDRDRCRQALADVLRQDADLSAECAATEADRRTQINELRALGSGGTEVNVDASAARRHYAVQLSGRLGELDVRRAALSREIDQRRHALVRADQLVRALENLAERREAEFILSQERLEARELEQAWQAIRATETSRC